MKLKALLSNRGKEYFYIMHLSYDGREKRRLWNYGKDNKMIGLSHREVSDDWVKVRGSVKSSLSKIWVKQFDMFCNEINKGDIVLVLNGWKSLLGVAEITEQNHEFRKGLSDFFDHIRHVKWKNEFKYESSRMLSKPVKGFNNTLYKVTPGTKRWSILAGLNI